MNETSRPGKVASKPLFRDPVFDGAADPIVVWNRQEHKWCMFYTNGDKPGEGPKVFRWNDRYWMIVDQWRGLGVYHSQDALNWTLQAKNILETPGQGLDDNVKGGHADVVVSGERAFLFYFTHPGEQTPMPIKTPTSSGAALFKPSS
jgi:hypothetical protein